MKYLVLLSLIPLTTASFGASSGDPSPPPALTPPPAPGTTAELHRPDLKVLSLESAKIVTDWSVKFLQ